MNSLILSDGQALRVREYHLEVYAIKTRREVSRYYMRELPFNSVIITALGGFLTYEAISFLGTHNVPILFLNPAGRLESVLLHGERSFQSENRLAQYRAYLNADLRERITEDILRRKAESQLSFIRELSTTYGFDFRETDLTQDDERKQSAAYFGYLCTVFNQLYKTEYRGRRAESNMTNANASHPVNALLNFGYAVLEGRVRAVLWEFGLDSALGFNHEHYRGKASLAFDLMEVFRADIDRAVVRLLESGIHRRDFDISRDYTARLKPETIKRFVGAIDLTDERIRDEVRALMRVIGGTHTTHRKLNRKTLYYEQRTTRQSVLRETYQKSLEQLSATINA